MSSISRSTIPWIRRRQSAATMAGMLEGGVDAVEVVVRRDERRDAFDAEVRAGRDGRGQLDGRGDGDRSRGGRGRATGREEQPMPPDPNASRPTPAAPIRNRRRDGVVAAGVGLTRRSCRNSRAPTPAAAPISEGAMLSGEDVGRASAAAAPTTPNSAIAAAASRGWRSEIEPDHDRERGDRRGHPAEQRDLVVGAERLDGERLEPLGREVDDRAADGEEW